MSINKYKYTHEEIHVPLDTLIENEGFNQKNLEVHKEMCDKTNHQEVYGDENGKGIRGGLQFVGKKLIPVDNIDDDYKFGKQKIRAKRNPEEKNIKKDIRRKGYNLSLIPPAVELKADGSYKILEGRTRYAYYMVNDFKYIIADVYVHVDESENPEDFSYFMNNYGDKKGFTEKDDLVVFLTDEIQSEKKPCENMKRNQIVEWIKGREKALGTTLTKSERDNLVHTAIEHLTGAKPILTFGNADDVKKWLTDCGYKDTKKVRYVPITSDVDNGRKSLRRKTAALRAEGFTGKIRGIIWSGTLAGKNPVGDWKFRNLEIFERYKEVLMEEGENYFEEAKFKKEITSLFYGCVPQCVALEKDYPLDKIVKYRGLK